MSFDTAWMSTLDKKQGWKKEEGGMRTEQKQIPKCFDSVFPHCSIKLHPQLVRVFADPISSSVRMGESGRLWMMFSK